MDSDIESDIRGTPMFGLAKELWPINRSLSGEGVRETLRKLQKYIGKLEIKSVKTGARIFDWIVPQEWEISEAYLEDPKGNRILDFTRNNLHVIGYSTSVDRLLSLEELQAHLHSLPQQPTSIPYVTSYYEKRWGFSIDHESRVALQDGIYRAKITAEHFDGELNYGELVVPGVSEKEVLFSTYVCHPSMANNELSGPVLAAELAKFILQANRKYTYRFVFIPETIGSLVLLNQHLDNWKRNLIAGYVLTCVGDEREYSYIPSRRGDTFADWSVLSRANKLGINPVHYSWLQRGSDERQYCSPGADLPVCSLIRSKYGTYPEYHTSDDTLGDVVTPKGLAESFRFYEGLIEDIEDSSFPLANQVGEPQLGRIGLYPNLSIKGIYSETRLLLDVLSLADGTFSLARIADELRVEASIVEQMCDVLHAAGKIVYSEQSSEHEHRPLKV